MISFPEWYYSFPQMGYLLLLILPILYLFRSLFSYRQKVLASLVNSSHVSQLSTRYSRLSFWIKGLTICLIWSFACLALMEPQGNFKYITDSKKDKQGWVIPQDLIILIDASASMAAMDTRTGKSRLDTAKEIAGELIGRLNGQNGSLYAFTSDLSSLSPPTLDYLFLALALRGLSINEGGTAGTDFAFALESLKKRFWGLPSNKEYTLVILSDGEDTVLETLRGEERSKARDKILSPLKNALESHLRVFTIGIGSAAGAQLSGLELQGNQVTTRLHEELLKDMSLIGRGKYFSAASSSTLEIMQALLEEFQSNLVQAEKRQHPLLEQQKNENISYNLYFQIPLGIALLLLAGLLIYNPKPS